MLGSLVGLVTLLASPSITLLHNFLVAATCGASRVRQIAIALDVHDR